MTVMRATTLRSPGFVYRPVWLALLTVPIMGNRLQRLKQEESKKVTSFTVQPTQIRLEKNDHNQADTCSLTLDWTLAGVDSRMLDDAIVEVHVGNADEAGHCEWSEQTCRFVGVVREVDSNREADSAPEVQLECVDYTQLFLDAKPFGSLGVPKLSMTLAEAWATIVGTSVIDGKTHEHTPGTKLFRENPKQLVFQGVDPAIVLGKGVADRFRKLAFVPTKPDTDAWAVWQQCVGMLGLLSYIDKDRCIVTTATNYYTERDAPKMIWGKNIESWHESRVGRFSRRGVAITSFNPLTRSAVEAYWPPIGDAAVKRKRPTSKKVLSETEVRPTEERDYFAFPGVTEPDVLLDIAKRVHEERSRQELEGSISTPHMWVGTERGAIFDLLDLRAGDSIRVETEPEMKLLLSSLDTDFDRIFYLTERGYAEGAAELIIANMANFGDLDARFITKRVALDMSVDENGGSFSVEIDYINRIQIDGSATA